MPFCYGYARVSHKDQLAGESKAGQAKRAHQYWQSHLEELGIQWGLVIEEVENISAFRVPFKNRKGGAKLMNILRPGDHVVFDKIDRVWRTNRDFVELHQWFKDNAVTFHIQNMMGCSLVSNSPMGDFMLRLMVSLAEMEAAQISDRTKAAFKYAQECGFYTSRQAPAIPGLKVVQAVPMELNKKKKPKRMLAWDEPIRKIMRQIVEMREGAFAHLNEAVASRSISDLMHAAYGDGRKWRYPANRHWNPARVRLCYKLEKEIFPAIVEPRYADIKALLRMRDSM